MKFRGLILIDENNKTDEKSKIECGSLVHNASFGTFEAKVGLFLILESIFQLSREILIDNCKGNSWRHDCVRLFNLKIC